ncbi:MAG: FHA domain-containing protein [Polyangiaceae bacterium]|nr:FHA domain-containing protein [Polyangiaceae bacterium]
MWKLVIEDDEGKRTVVPLTRDEYSIGRREGNVIRLTERNVSREHARLYKKSAPAHTRADFVLEDLTSYNGVFVNGLRVHHAHDLVHGDLVQIGDYRIILQNEAAEQGVDRAADSKQTLPNSPMARSAGLLDRPNRLVMLAGPTPGAEFPLDRDRLTVGRAEDASISINHNSVSRLHCEVHALGDGRFEIVDKGSSNGVRVNGADLRRGIVEPGDVIELGDVRFKFIGAGQIFRPTESQQLAAIADRDAADVVRRRWSHGALPFAVFTVVVAAGGTGAWVYTRPHVRASSTAAATPPPEQAVLDEAKRICGGGAGDCELAHTKIESAISESSRFRDSQTFKDIESQWAQSVIERADATADPGAKRELYQRVAQTVSVDPMRRKVAADRLQQLDSNAAAASPNALELPIVPTPPSSSAPPPTAPKTRADEPVASSARAESTRRGSTAAADPPSAAAGSVGTGPSNVEDKERQLALQGTLDSKLALKQQLESRVYAGRASDTEIHLLISTCRELRDQSCIDQARTFLRKVAQ